MLELRAGEASRFQERQRNNEVSKSLVFKSSWNNKSDNF